MHTFVVRVHQRDEEPEQLRGVVDEVASGLSATFRDSRELLAILSHRSGPGAGTNIQYGASARGEGEGRNDAEGW